MTIEEKRKAIQDYCENNMKCEECPVDALYNGIHICYSESADIETHYKVLFGDSENEAVKENDVVNHPSHYTQGGIECIDAMEAAFGAQELAAYCKIAAFKYIWRCVHKNGLEDVKKAVWYLNKHIELMERDGK